MNGTGESNSISCQSLHYSIQIELSFLKSLEKPLFLDMSKAWSVVVNPTCDAISLVILLYTTLMLT